MEWSGGWLPWASSGAPDGFSCNRRANKYAVAVTPCCHHASCDGAVTSFCYDTGLESGDYILLHCQVTRSARMTSSE